LSASEARRRRPTGFALRARAQAVVKGQRTMDKACEKVGSETTQEFLQVGTLAEVLALENSSEPPVRRTRFFGAAAPHALAAAAAT
jgi:hypothetical protein